MSGLSDALEENWPIDQIEIKCDECDTIIDEIEGGHVAIETKPYVELLIKHIIQRHVRKRSHDAYTISIIEHDILEDVNCEITINEN